MVTCESVDVKVINQIYLRVCEAELEEVSGHELEQQNKVLFKTNDSEK